ncbi:43658_t:CDS:2, partial [Gigaspora margarita]
DLRPGFDIPSSKTLAGKIFNKQFVQVETKIKKELQIENKIETMIIQIGKEKICAIVSDSSANIVATRQIIIQKFPYILNVSYIAHRLNLICKNIMKKSFAKHILSQATLVTQFFRSCHIANLVLKKEIQINNIVAQLASYQLNELPYNEPFEPDYEPSQTWWKILENVYIYLLTLAAKLLNITSHSASLEGLAKIHRYYMTHAKEEISYINCELTLEDVLIVANKSEELDADDSDSEEDLIEDNKVEFESLDEILCLKEKFDLDHEIFG